MLNDILDRTLVLTEEEKRYCWETGAYRQRCSSRKGHVNKKVSSRDDIHTHAIGVCGEVAARRYLGLSTQVISNNYRAADLPGNIEVRTRTNRLYDLKVLPDDEDTRFMIHAFTPEFGQPVELVGWFPASEGKRLFPNKIDPWNAGQPFHPVPTDRLLPMWFLRGGA